MSAAALKERPAKSSSHRRAQQDTTINFRVSTQMRALIDAAADAEGKTRTQFVMDSAKKHAIDVLLDQRLFRLDDSSFDAFVAALDRPPEPNERLKKLLSEKSPWEN